MGGGSLARLPPGVGLVGISQDENPLRKCDSCCGESRPAMEYRDEYENADPPINHVGLRVIEGVLETMLQSNTEITTIVVGVAVGQQVEVKRIVGVKQHTKFIRRSR